MEYSVVLTSCGRFDLLRRTVQSFLQFADGECVRFVVAEDSGDDGVRDVLSGLDAPFDFVVNRPRLGQAAAIDAGYARIETPLVFHCEDDWEFFRPGFIGESAAVLAAHPQISAVMLRGREESALLRDLPEENIAGVRFFRARARTHREYYGYSYNPGLRRLADYRRVAPFAAIGGENEVSYVYKKLGYATAHLESPAVRHIGDGRHIDDRARPPAKTPLQKLSRSLRKRAKKIKWQVFGLPGANKE